MSANITDYGNRTIWAIEVFTVTSEDPVERWRLAATHETKQQALNDLRFRFPNRLVEVLVSVQRIVDGDPPLVRETYSHALHLYEEHQKEQEGRCSFTEGTLRCTQHGNLHGGHHTMGAL